MEKNAEKTQADLCCFVDRDANQRSDKLEFGGLTPEFTITNYKLQIAVFPPEMIKIVAVGDTIILNL